MTRTVEIKESEFRCGNALTELIHEIDEAYKDGISTLNVVGINKYRKPSFECNARLYLDRAVSEGKLKDYSIIFK